MSSTELENEIKALLQLAKRNEDHAMLQKTDRDSSFIDADRRKHFSQPMTEYSSMELRELEKALDELWQDERAMQELKLPILAAFLKTRKKTASTLPAVEIYNYTL